MFYLLTRIENDNMKDCRILFVKICLTYPNISMTSEVGYKIR